MINTDLEPCYILHSRKYRDTSLILELFGAETGRHAAVARGARSQRSKLRGQLQPFTPLLVSVRGRAELKTCAQVDFRGNAYGLKGEELILGLYINELLYKLLGVQEPLPALFAAYEELLGELSQRPGQLKPARRFELTLLRELGYGIDFTCEAATGKAVTPGQSYRYVVREGFYPVPSDEGGALSGADLLAIAEGCLDKVEEAALRRITRLSLHHLLGDKPLKSRDLFRALPR